MTTCSTPWILENEQNFPEVESSFLLNPYPSKSQVEALAKRTRFTEEYIDDYFSIRRGDEPKIEKPSIFTQTSERIHQDQALTKQGLNVFHRCVPPKNQKSLEAELREVEEMETLRVRLATSEVSRKMLGAELHQKIQDYEIQISEMKAAEASKEKQIHFLETERTRLEKTVKGLQNVLEGVGEELKEKEDLCESLKMAEAKLKEREKELAEVMEKNKKMVMELEKMDHDDLYALQDAEINRLLEEITELEDMVVAGEFDVQDTVATVLEDTVAVVEVTVDTVLQDTVAVSEDTVAVLKESDDTVLQDTVVASADTVDTVLQNKDTVNTVPHPETTNIVVVHPLAMLDVQDMGDTVLVDTVFEDIEKLDVQVEEEDTVVVDLKDFEVQDSDSDSESDFEFILEDTVDGQEVDFEDEDTVPLDTVVWTAEDLEKLHWDPVESDDEEW